MADDNNIKRPRKSEPIRNAGRRSRRPRIIGGENNVLFGKSENPSPSSRSLRQRRPPRMSTPSGRDRSTLRRRPTFKDNISLDMSDGSFSEISDTCLSSERSREYSYREIKMAKRRIEQYKLRSDPIVNDQLLRECDADKRRYIEKVKSRDSSRTEDDFEIRLVELIRRQRDIDRGRISDIYNQYITEIAKVDREAHHPRTPNKFRKVSRRAWDGMVKKWRRTLHNYQSLDPDEAYKSEMSNLGDDDEDDGEASDDCLSSPWNVDRQQPVVETEENTLQAEGRENATSTRTVVDESTLEANVPSMNLKGRLPLSSSNRPGPVPDVLHSGLTNDINAISMTKKSEEESASQPTQLKRRSSTRRK